MNDDDDVKLPYGLPIGGPSLSLQGVALAAAMVPFVCHYAETRTVNGVVVSYIDYVAITAGLIAIPLGLWGLFKARSATERRGVSLALAGAAVVLGAVQLALGFGLFV